MRRAFDLTCSRGDGCSARASSLAFVLHSPVSSTTRSYANLCVRSLVLNAALLCLQSGGLYASFLARFFMPCS